MSVRRRLAETLDSRRASRLSGRRRELALLDAMLDDPQVRVLHLHGVPGIGKSSLLDAWTAALADGRPDARVVRLDARTVEPSPPGFLAALARALGHRGGGGEQLADALADAGRPAVLALDTYEGFRLLDSWLRTELLPLLPDDVRVVLAGREPPSPGWLTDRGWAGLFRSVELAPLSESEAVDHLCALGLGRGDARRVARISRGHPLALAIAASLPPGFGPEGLEALTAERLIGELARRSLEHAPDPEAQECLRAACAVRRVTLPLLRGLLPEHDASRLFDRLRALPYARLAADGLFIHDAVRDAVGTILRAADPALHSRLRRRALDVLHEELRATPRSDLWRTTADLLYLIDQPVVREGFFPSGSTPLAVDAARTEDHPAIGDVIERWYGVRSAGALRFWLREHPESFHVVRDGSGAVVGFYHAIAADRACRAVLATDPVAQRWARLAPGARPDSVLWIRANTALATGDDLSPVVGAAAVDLKRLYMAMRPALRFVYVALPEGAGLLDAMRMVGFERLEQATVTVGGETTMTMRLDMGPSSVEGWLIGLVGRDLAGAPEASPIRVDDESLALVLPGGAVRLGPLELGVVRLLLARPGRVVSRAELLDHVWGEQRPVGSNVVEAVVRTLRRKLGSHADLIETVRGAGYRARLPA